LQKPSKNHDASSKASPSRGVSHVALLALFHDANVRSNRRQLDAGLNTDRDRRKRDKGMTALYESRISPKVGAKAGPA
jgi:hypothetical protein